MGASEAAALPQWGFKRCYNIAEAIRYVVDPAGGYLARKFLSNRQNIS